VISPPFTNVIGHKIISITLSIINTSFRSIEKIIGKGAPLKYN